MPGLLCIATASSNRIIGGFLCQVDSFAACVVLFFVDNQPTTAKAVTPSDFIGKWQGNSLSERAGAQAYFLDLCDLLGVEKPNDPENYCFERGQREREPDTAGRTSGSATASPGKTKRRARTCPMP